jgi:hypothetical protein
MLTGVKVLEGHSCTYERGLLVVERDGLPRVLHEVYLQCAHVRHNIGEG